MRFSQSASLSHIFLMSISLGDCHLIATACLHEQACEQHKRKVLRPARTGNVEHEASVCEPLPDKRQCCRPKIKVRPVIQCFVHWIVEHNSPTAHQPQGYSMPADPTASRLFSQLPKWRGWHIALKGQLGDLWFSYVEQPPLSSKYRSIVRPAREGRPRKLVKEKNKSVRSVSVIVPALACTCCALKGLGFFPNRGRWLFCVSLEMVIPFFCRDTRHVVWQGTRFALPEHSKEGCAEGGRISPKSAEDVASDVTKSGVE